MPNRIIKETICTSDTIDQLSWFEECFFSRLIVNCDDYGRFDGRTAIIKSRLFPLKSNVTDKLVTDTIDKLLTVGLVMPYEWDGKPTLQLVTWDKHQTVRNKRSKYPAADGSETTTASENVQFIAHYINCNQLNADEIKCPRNPIQSESNPNPNPSIPVPDGTDAYQDIFDHYMTLGLIQHRALTKEMRSAIDIARRRCGYSWGLLKTLLDRHAYAVKLTENDGEYSVRPRPIVEFFGQKVKGGTALICSEYSDDGSKWLRYKDGNPNKALQQKQDRASWERPIENCDHLAEDLFSSQGG